MMMMINTNDTQTFRPDSNPNEADAMNQLQMISSQPHATAKPEGTASPSTDSERTESPKPKSSDEQKANELNGTDRKENLTKKSQEIIFAHNPKVYHQETREWLVLAQDKSSGQLAWVSASSGMVPRPPADHIVAVAAPGDTPQFNAPNPIPKSSYGVQKIDTKQNLNILNFLNKKTATGTKRDERLRSFGRHKKTKKRSMSFSSIHNVLAAAEKHKGPENETCATGNISLLLRKGKKRGIERSDSLASVQPSPSKPFRRLSASKRCFSMDAKDTTRTKRGRIRKPKHPKTGYNFFQLSVRDRLCRDLPKQSDRVLHNEKVARIIGQRWKALSAQERRVFQDMAENDKVRYENEMRVYLDYLHTGMAAKGKLKRTLSVDNIGTKTFRRSILTSNDDGKESGTKPTSQIGENSGNDDLFQQLMKNQKQESPVPNLKAVKPKPFAKRISFNQIKKSPMNKWGGAGVRFVTSARSFDAKAPKPKRSRPVKSTLRSAKSFDFSRSCFLGFENEDENNGKANGEVSSWLDDIFDDKVDDWTKDILDDANRKAFNSSSSSSASSLAATASSPNLNEKLKPFKANTMDVSSSTAASHSSAFEAMLDLSDSTQSTSSRSNLSSTSPRLPILYDDGSCDTLRNPNRRNFTVGGDTKSRKRNDKDGDQSLKNRGSEMPKLKLDCGNPGFRRLPTINELQLEHWDGPGDTLLPGAFGEEDDLCQFGGN